MSEKDLMNVDNLEIEALSDEELESVAGGETDTTTAASCSCCTATATNQGSEIKQM